MDQVNFLFLVKRNVGIKSKIVFNGRLLFEREIRSGQSFIKNSAFLEGWAEKLCSFQSLDNSKKQYL